MHSLPPACASLTLKSALRRSNRSTTGGSFRSASEGGSWGYCTHLKTYGLNMDFGLANMLLSLAPRSTLELGCGLGLYTSFLHQAAGTRLSIGIEPHPMPSVIFGSDKGPHQLVANVLSPSGEVARCEELLGRFELVFSIEMAEHVPRETHPMVADLLVRHTGGFLVFSAGRPGQLGLGHVGNREKSEWISMFTERGLVHLPETSRRMSEASRNIEHHFNVVAFAAKGTPLGQAYDGPTHSRDAGAEATARFRRGYPPNHLAWLTVAPCRERGYEGGGYSNKRPKDGCNATHPVPFLAREHSSSNFTAVPVPTSLAPTGVRIPWMARHRLREGELALWPELVVEHAKCFSYNDRVHEYLDRVGVSQ